MEQNNKNIYSWELRKRVVKLNVHFFVTNISASLFLQTLVDATLKDSKSGTSRRKKTIDENVFKQSWRQGRAFPPCCLRGFCLGPAPFVLCCTRPPGIVFWVFLVGLQVPLYPLVSAYIKHFKHSILEQLHYTLPLLTFQDNNCITSRKGSRIQRVCPSLTTLWNSIKVSESEGSSTITSILAQCSYAEYWSHNFACVKRL